MGKNDLVVTVTISGPAKSGKSCLGWWIFKHLPNVEINAEGLDTDATERPKWVSHDTLEEACENTTVRIVEARESKSKNGSLTPLERKLARVLLSAASDRACTKGTQFDLLEHMDQGGCEKLQRQIAKWRSETPPEDKFGSQFVGEWVLAQYLADRIVGKM